MVEHDHMVTVYPRLGRLFEQITPLPALSPKPTMVADAVVKIVVGQMLSRSAANTIYSRIFDTRTRRQVSGCWQLSEADLHECGLSGRKNRAIREFGSHYDCNPKHFEGWRELEHNKLSAEVCKHWGLSKWSADMLSIFYFANPDVFPETDGTIIRVRRCLEEKHLSKPLVPELASRP